MICETIGHEEMVVVAQPQSDLTVGAERWIGFPLRAAQEDFGRLLRSRLAAAGRGPAEIFVVDSLSAQKRLVEAGLGCALLPRSSLREELQARTLAIVERPAIATTIPIALIRRHRGLVASSRPAESPFYRVAEIGFPSRDALLDFARSTAAMEGLASSRAVSTGGEPIYLSCIDDGPDHS